MKIKNRSRICLIISGSIILIALLLTIFGVLYTVIGAGGILSLLGVF